MNNSKNKPTILVTGGAGYIGSATALCLKEQGYPVVIIDNLSRGFQATIDSLDLPFEKGNVGDAEFVKSVCKKYKPDAVIHFAAFAYVGESVSSPDLYYKNNVVESISFITTLKECGVNNFVFSSTCATYGVTQSPISEQNAQNPINSYGRSKLMIEKVLSDYSDAFGLNYIAFRYFNVAGTHPSYLVGERHNPESHLLPRAIFSLIGGPGLQVFGTDYPTPDGTCIRDYVHVKDIASAHILGLEYLLSKKQSNIFNIGTGKGFSVLEVIKAVEEVSGKKVPWAKHERRAGDPAELIAAPDKLKQTLGWKPEYTSIVEIARTAYEWYKKHPELTC